MKIRPSPLRAAVRLSLFALLNVVMIAAMTPCVGPARRWRRPLQVLWSRGCCRLAGLRVRVLGAPYDRGPALFAANHVSYLDIPALAAVIDAAFVAKSEVARWPVFGTAAKLTRTVFVQRTGADASAQRRAMQSRLARGESLLLFAEGTSTDGSRVAPFKTSLFSVAEPSDQSPSLEMVVQPVSIAYPRYADGTPLVGPLRALYGWYGDATLVPHLLRVMGLKGAEVEVRLHGPIQAGPAVNRKRLARWAEAAVAEGVAAANATNDRFCEDAHAAPSLRAAPPASGETRQPTPKVR